MGWRGIGPVLLRDWVAVGSPVLEVTMKTLSVLALATAVSAALGSAPVAAQQRALTPSPQFHAVNPSLPGPQFHAVNPSLSLSAPTNSPLKSRCGRTTLPA